MCVGVSSPSYDQDTIQTQRRSHLRCNPLVQSHQSKPIHFDTSWRQSDHNRWSHWKSVAWRCRRLVGRSRSSQRSNQVVHSFTLLHPSRPPFPRGFDSSSSLISYCSTKSGWRLSSSKRLYVRQNTMLNLPILPDRFLATEHCINRRSRSLMLLGSGLRFHLLGARQGVRAAAGD